MTRDSFVPGWILLTSAGEVIAAAGAAGTLDSQRGGFLGGDAWRRLHADDPAAPEVLAEVTRLLADGAGELEHEWEQPGSPTRLRLRARMLPTHSAPPHLLLHYEAIWSDDRRAVVRPRSPSLTPVPPAGERDDHVAILQLADASPDAMIGVDADGSVVLFNDAASRLLSVDPGDALGSPLARFVAPSHVQRHAEWSRPFLQAGVARRTGRARVFPVRRGDGREVWVSATITKLDGVRLRAVAIMRDVREGDGGRADERAMSYRLETIGRLSSSLVHDLCNALTVIGGNAEAMVSDEPLPDAVETGRLEIVAAVRQATQLVRQVLAFARGAGAPPRTVVDLGAVVQDSLTLFRRLVAPVSLSLERGAGAWIAADVAGIENGVANLLANARDACAGLGGAGGAGGAGGEGDRSSIALHVGTLDLDHPRFHHVGMAPAGRWSVLVVRDRGAGIAPDSFPKLFTPFFTTKDDGRGTGLGLASVQRTVLEAQGHVCIDSQVGVGTTVTLYLPRPRQGSE